ncbi:T9SS type A sorting domain-containing protein [Autumnicola psychrophila]|uniref:T9SS type A sorting domain-containing protein n=1 Tax=Autumnicola psychrophila TaxID=3075592 RepID=A0ABU3DTC3_9FLAO|nr:T9SS type A sorting domain-containing protein [Zunongwangia sp. F225]MDT0686972.1 T9SS type A sorting domain-containing protein [Zunongwangia sp. F225]
MMKKLQFLGLFLLLGVLQGYSQETSGKLPDVWDFGATQLDESEYNNQLSEEIINSWYDASITPGTSGINLPDFAVGDLSFTGGGSDRLRTSNTNLTRYDDNIDESEDFKGRVYINSSGATGRFLSLKLSEGDEVTIWALSQEGDSNIHFENAADSEQQNDVVAVGEEITELKFTAETSGTYNIYDDTGKPSYFRIVRESNTMSSESGSDLTDAWDFGATQLDEAEYKNQLSEEIIISWYDASITPGTSGVNLPDFKVGDLRFTGGGSDRLRTSNVNLTRYDDDIDEYEDFKGRVYINSSGATGRFFSLDLTEGDEVTIWALSQEGDSNIHFENTSDSELQNDVVAVGEEITELNFTAETSGIYKIYDDTGKPSYFRILRKSANNATVSGNVDVTAASDIPGDYSIVFTNESGDTWSSSVSEGAYTLDLPAGFTYDISLEGADGYSITGSSNIEITENTALNLLIQKDGAAGNGLADVWDFGATQLDETQFKNQLSEEVINSWYDESITPGTSGINLPDFTVGDLSFTGGGSDRLRTTNINLTRYDDDINEYEDFKGRLYINSSGATGRYFSLELNEDDEISLWTLTQNGNGNIHFEYVADPELQNDVVAVGGELTEVNFMAKTAGTYHIYDDTDKPSYFRIVRKSATYTTLTGNVNVAEAEGIPSDFSVVFTNELGKTWQLPFTNGGSYSVVLPVGYQYEVSLEGAEGYSIDSNSSLEVTESTSSYDIDIVKDLIYVEGLADVWDFGATQLDESQYNNMLNEARINSWYDESITPGTSGHTLPDFTAGDLSFTGGGSDRLRTTNLNLTRYDDDIDEYEDFKGRVYINSRGATNRFISLDLKEDDKVTLWVLGQDGNGELYFENTANPELQNDVVSVGGELQEVSFVANASGTYHIYDTADKPSYFRIIRTPATYTSLSGNIDLTEAPEIPDDYSIVFSIEEGKTWNLTPTDGSYQIELPTGFDYNIALEGADGYVISDGASVTITESTATHDITIEKVEIYSVTGSIVGLDENIEDLAITFTPDPGAGALYVPKPMIDTDAGTYSVNLEPNVQYTIESEGVDGYYIPENTLEITGESTSDIVFEAEPDGPFGDIDGDGILNADDNCLSTPNPDQADVNENGVGDVCEDDDEDGIINYEDDCPDTPEGSIVDVFGCEIFDLAADNFNISVYDVSCNGKDDGYISISAVDTNYAYNVAVSGTGTGTATLSSSNGFSADIENLAAGSYELCVTVDGQDNYEQCYNVTVEGPTPLEAYSSINNASNSVTFSLDGAEVYTIEHNGEITTTSQSRVSLNLEKGRNKFIISTNSECQGTFYKEVLMSEEVVLFPNPTKGDLQVYINGADTNVNVSLMNLSGTKFISEKMEIPSDRVIHLDLTNYRNGVYFLQLKSATVSKTLKVIKS